MTYCDDCKKEYHTVESCTFPYVSIEGQVHPRKKGYTLAGKFKKDLEEAPSAQKQCDDCGVLMGKTHHYGCTLEECPVCGEALATCECDDVKMLQTRYGN